MRVGVRQYPPQYGGSGVSSPGYLAVTLSSFFSKAVRSGMTSSWLETHAANRLPLGRLAKYWAEISRVTFATVPAMETCRSNCAQNIVNHAYGFSANSRPLRLS